MAAEAGESGAAGEAKGKETPKKSSWARNTIIRVASAFVLIPVILWLLFWGPAVGWVIFCYVGIVVVSSELMAMTLPGRAVLQVVGIASTVALLTVILYAPTFPALMATLIATVGVAHLAGLVRPDPIETASHRTG